MRDTRIIIGPRKGSWQAIYQIKRLIGWKTVERGKLRSTTDAAYADVHGFAYRLHTLKSGTFVTRAARRRKAKEIGKATLGM